MAHGAFQVRVTGVLVEDGRILLVKQRVSDVRGWSLPGGRAEAGETLEQAVQRELREETGLETRVVKLLYLCEKPEADPPLLHISFLLERIGGSLRLPDNSLDTNPISDIEMVPLEDLAERGFGQPFIERVRANFGDAGSYQGHKRNIGL